MDKLLPCPHCGGVAKIAGTKIAFYGGVAHGWRIWCDTPDCTLGMNSNKQEECVSRWNTRAAPSVRLPQRYDVTVYESVLGLEKSFDTDQDGDWMKADDVLAMLREAGIGVEGEANAL